MKLKDFENTSESLSKEDAKKMYELFLHTAKVGIEIEGNRSRSDNCIDIIHDKIANELNCYECQEYIQDISKIKRHFLYVYCDGSCNTELVTNSVSLDKLEAVLKRGFRVLKKYNVNISPKQQAGAHQTFSYSGYFPQVVGKNVVQLVRFYLPALVSISCITGTNYRESYYRQLPPKPVWKEESKSFNCKYEGVYVKEQNAIAGNPKLLEFRYPDSTTNIRQHLVTAIINKALVLKAINLSTNGIVSFSSSHESLVKEAIYIIYNDGLKNCSNWLEYSNYPKDLTLHKFIRDLREGMLIFFCKELKDIIDNYADFMSAINSWKIPVTSKQTETLDIKLR